MTPSSWCRTGVAALAALLGMSAASGAAAQFEPPTEQRGPKLAPVTALPPPGTYTSTTGVALSAPAGAEIHYTWDGSKPTEKSARLDPGQVLPIAGIYDGERGLTSGYTLRAIATQAGHTDSDTATFTYTVARRDRTAYVSEEVSPGVRMIRDSDNDKMFLIRGARAWALVDTGMGRGDLRGYVARFTGGAPVFVILTHFHPDHSGQAGQFVASSPVYIGAADRAVTARILAGQGASATAIAANLKPLDDGSRIDLGDRSLEIGVVPGHTPGSIAILDSATGDLFTGDTFGNNSPLPPDVMWLQWYDRPLDVYLANVRAARRAFAGPVRRIFTGHNDRPLTGTAYLDNLERAIQAGLDRGEAALIPSWRPAGGVQLVVGDRFRDPDWFGVNVNRQAFLPAPPDRIARLADLAVTGGTLSPYFDPDVHDYVVTRHGAGPLAIAAIPSATRSRALRLDGRAVRAGETMRLSSHATGGSIEVISPDGQATGTYRFRIAGGPAR